MSLSTRIACLLFVLCTPTSTAKVNPQLVSEFFTQRRLRSVVLIHCDSDVQDLYYTSHFLAKNYRGAFRVANIRDGIQTLNFPHIMQSDPSDLGLTLDLSCQHTESLFDMMSQKSFFNASYEWLLFGVAPLDQATNLLCQQNLNVDSRVTLATLDQHKNDSYALHDVYNVFFHRGGKFRVSPTGHWSFRKGFNLTWNENEYDRRMDFQGVKLRGVFTDLRSRHNETNLQRQESKKPVTQYAMFRFGHLYMNMVKQKHNFSIDYIQVPNWGIESIVQNTSAGVIGQIKDRYVDFSDNLVYPFSERIPFLDYSIVIGTHITMIVFRHPKRSNARNAFLEPFDQHLWYAMLAITIVSSMVLGATIWIGSKLSSQPSRSSREYCLTIIGFICQQGYEGIVFLGASKMTAVVILFFSALMYQFYGTFIIGSLLTPPPKNIRTVRQLIDSRLEVTMENIFYNWDFYNKTRDPEAAELFAKKITKGSEKPTHITHGIGLIKKGGFAIQCDIGYTYPIIKNTFTDDEICELQEIQISPHRPLLIPLQKGSPLKQYFWITMRKLVESGSGTYYKREYFSRKPPCPRDDLETMQIDVEQVSSIFAFLILAMLTSMVLLVAERMYYRYQMWRMMANFIE